ncbi:hypothetical protein [Yeosuana sp.]|mgnify:CR=1 FL=1|uniref:hypothetical protein n=1 Tax=Yeosuana sp. TaxID=2529388 RepID=UPI004054B4B7|tara:strand:+ start:527 stop:1195 length:669 start_codon:yes stop_codon:yes gene_type:complete
MKLNFICFILFAVTLSVTGQIDNKSNSTTIPAIPNKKDSAETLMFKPNKTNENNAFNGLSVPKTNSSLNVPQKEFSMFGETFGNPGELYEKRINKNKEAIKEEMGLGGVGSKTDQYFGNFNSKSKFIRVLYRDFGLEDGDLISVSVNDELINPRVLLTNGYKGFKLDLVQGFNKIDFLALNEGYALPNTAEFQVIDDLGNTIASNMWNLSTGVKATIIIVKE